MGLGHEKLDAYRLSIGCLVWVYEEACSVDFDPDSDFDPEERKFQRMHWTLILHVLGSWFISIDC